MARKQYNLKVITTISLRPEMLHMLDREAEMRDVSRSWLIEHIIKEHFEGGGNGIKKENAGTDRG